jgi:hypothetical protein
VTLRDGRSVIGGAADDSPGWVDVGEVVGRRVQRAQPTATALLKLGSGHEPSRPWTNPVGCAAGWSFSSPSSESSAGQDPMDGPGLA